MKRLSIEQWENIFRNLQDNTEENIYGETWVSVLYLDSINNHISKWGLAYGEELFEEGFETEEETLKRLQYLENKILGHTITI